jgi:hypothetical protein
MDEILIDQSPVEARPQQPGHGRRLVCWLAFTLLFVPAVGCNDRPTAQVKGKVLYKDGSVPKGGVRVIRFEPTADTTAAIRKTASSEIADDGSFDLFTRKPGDGVILGKYAVTFSVWRGPRDRVSLIDEKYTAKATTPYTVTVEDDMDDLMFEIEPIGGATGARPAAEAPPAAEASPADG